MGATGWTLPEIDALSMDDVTELFAEWNEDPPMAEIVKARCGFQRKTPADEVSTEPKDITEAEWDRMVASFTAGVADLNAAGGSHAR